MKIELQRYVSGIILNKKNRASIEKIVKELENE